MTEPSTMRLVPLLLVVAALMASGCESVRPGTVTSTNERFIEATRASILDDYNWPSWPRVILGRPEDAYLHRENWRGVRDASAQIAVDVYGDRLTVVGMVMDDRPLRQPYARPRQPLRTGVPFAGDAVELRFIPAGERAEPVSVLIEFGSDGTAGRMSVTESARAQPAVLPGSFVAWERTELGYNFVARSLGLDRFGLRPLWSMGYRIEATLHDFDRDIDDYSVLRSYTIARPRR